MLISIAPKLLWSQVMTGAACAFGAFAALNFLPAELNNLLCYIFGQGGFFLETPVTAFLDSGIKNGVLGAQFLCHIQNPPFAMEQGIAFSPLPPFQMSPSLPQVPIGSASPSPSQEASLWSQIWFSLSRMHGAAP